MSPTRGRLSRLMALAALLAAVMAPLAVEAQPQQPPPRVEEEIAVRETSVVVELPDTLRDGRNGRLGTGDFLVMVDGKLRRVLRAEPLSDDEPWSLVVYVDRVLAKADTQFPALLALAQRSGELAARGSVEVVVADPAPRVALAATREPQRIREVLSDLAGEARLARQGSDAGREAPSLTADVLRRQLDRLLTRLAARTTAGPRALFLVADGMDLPPEQVERLARVPMGRMTSEAAPSGPAALFVEASRLLAAYGWVTFALPFRDLGESPGEESRGTDEATLVRRSADYGDLNASVPPVILQGKPGRPSSLQLPRVIDLFVLPDLAPLRALTQPTAGTVVGFPEQLDFVLRGLGRRWEVSYESPESVNGRLSSFEVMVPTAQVRPRTQRWIRASTPEEIAEARLRLLVGGGTSSTGEGSGDLPATISAEAKEDGLALHIEVEPFSTQGSPPAGPVRISHALVRQGGEVQVRHQLVPGIAKPDQGWSRDVTIPLPSGTLGVAVLVEDLARQRWSTAVLAPGTGAGR